MTIKLSADSVAELEWFKSSYSSTDGPDCVEVASTVGTIHIRDSKNKQGARLGFGPQRWAAFVAHVREAD
ncbi:hypothetical protein QF026_006076 [Streptomyces aurantiacus]|uniref:DUF397 domain-containing protein n=1 Tax=Streptomyces aurantiacus TaxID=47760 RepID=UPI00278E015F|nr:DUF397 domain-containing protein [Streptomyces aurantiacus]MDQ0777610.1 hypothetical protein [Streptomyces aurantiacus]